MSMTPRNPKDQDGHEKRMLSNQPRLMCNTPTALLGSWVLQPIKDMMFLKTDFEMHANWQGSVEESAAKDFVARKNHTIALSEMQGTHWNIIKCKERFEDCLEAVIGQATMNLDSQLWKSLEDPLPKLYCLDLAEAHVMQESVSLRKLSEKKRYDLQLPNGHSHEKHSAKDRVGKENW
jgi:hypothetical protein